jgi:mRNA interferase RelE/StbE
MSYKQSSHPHALMEWNKLDASVCEIFKKKLAERLQIPHIPAATLSGLKNGFKIKLEEAGYRLVYEVCDDALGDRSLRWAGVSATRFIKLPQSGQANKLFYYRKNGKYGSVSRFRANFPYIPLNPQAAGSVVNINLCSSAHQIEQFQQIIVTHADAADGTRFTHFHTIRAAMDIDVPAHGIYRAKPVKPQLTAGEP